MDNNKPKCPACGSDLELEIGFTGCDWNCEAGENSGYDYQVSLNCPKHGCGRVFTLGMIKNDNDFSLIKSNIKL